MDFSLLVAFWIVSFSLVMTPGADWAYAISSGMRNKMLLPAVSGMLLGYVVITVVVAAGVGALVASVPVILTVLTYAGAAYLLWLGVGVLRNPPVPSAGNFDGEVNGFRTLMKGFGISGINPKALLLFLALLPQFTSRDAGWSVGVQIFFMGLIQIINCAVVYSAVGLGSKAILRTRPEAARRVSQFSGIAMIFIAFLLIGEQIYTALE